MAEKIRVLVSEEDVDRRIEELGKQISEDYAGKAGSFDLCSERRRVLPV